MIELINVSKYFVTDFGRHYVFRNVNLVLPLDKSVAVLGPNGAGKSTFLRLLGGADQPSTGTILKTGRISPPMGLTPSLQPSLNGVENARFAGRIYGMERDEINEMIEYVRKLANIGKFFNMPVSTYSAGMRQRVAFAINMSMQFDYYLFDEIGAGGDREFRKIAKKMVKERLASSKFIMTSHNTGELLDICDSGIVIQNGELRFFEDVRDAVAFYGENPDDELRKEREELGESSGRRRSDEQDPASGDDIPSSLPPPPDRQSRRAARQAEAEARRRAKAAERARKKEEKAAERARKAEARAATKAARLAQREEKRARKAAERAARPDDAQERKHAAPEGQPAAAEPLPPVPAPVPDTTSVPVAQAAGLPAVAPVAAAMEPAPAAPAHQPAEIPSGPNAREARRAALRKERQTLRRQKRADAPDRSEAAMPGSVTVVTDGEASGTSPADDPIREARRALQRERRKAKQAAAGAGGQLPAARKPRRTEEERAAAREARRALQREQRKATRVAGAEDAPKPERTEEERAAARMARRAALEAKRLEGPRPGRQKRHAATAPGTAPEALPDKIAARKANRRKRSHAADS